MPREAFEIVLDSWMPPRAAFGPPNAVPVLGSARRVWRTMHDSWDDRVLRGAAQTLERTRLVCIESLPTNPGIDSRIDALMQASGFCEIQRIAFDRFFQSQRRSDLGARRSA